MADFMSAAKGSLEQTSSGRSHQQAQKALRDAKRGATPSAVSSEKVQRSNDRVAARRRNTFEDLLSPSHHLDHKLVGLGYIVSQCVTFYFLFFRFEEYEASLFLTCLTPLMGIIVTLTALRNFHFLPKQAENPGMFAENRTFSYAFLQENLWFQFVVSWGLFAVAPAYTRLVNPWFSVGFLLFLFYFREVVPKTSYTSWQVGNEKVNQKKYESWSVKFINLQVKIVRWNYVLKKYLLYYLIVNIALERLGFIEAGSVNPFDRKMHYILSLDAMHNITTAFFIQTLKFKGFISAFTFSMAFNASPILGLVFTYYFCAYHTFKWVLVTSILLDMCINLSVLYPSRLSHVWKNRAQVLVKMITTGAAVAYYATPGVGG